MKAIMVMFDSLNRRLLQPYGCHETITPNFSRLAEHTVRFENCYAGSLPCMPARRELHTGRYNFLHRSWGPLEPFDCSVFAILRKKGIYTHLVSDHAHYWETGGATYHTQYTTWEGIRGREGDPWVAVVGGVTDDNPNFVSFSEGLRSELYKQNIANRTKMKRKENYPLVKTFDAGLDFLRQNGEKDSWFLQIESFSPHEPFTASQEFKCMYPSKEKGKKFEWPDYAPVKEEKNIIEEVKYAYYASLSMCDEQLGRILDIMDEKDMWKDTMLIVNTDHGYMLGEHGYWAKNYMPCYDEIAHIPLFIWNPKFPDAKNVSRKSLVQTIDIPASILGFFEIPLEEIMQGKDVSIVLEQDMPIRRSGLFGVFGGHICGTDGRYVYMRSPKNLEVPLCEYTLMPTHMMDFFSKEELMSMERRGGSGFSHGFPVMKIETDSSFRCIEHKELLFDLQNDPAQKTNIVESEIRNEMERQMYDLMLETDCPKELFQRFGF